MKHLEWPDGRVVYAECNGVRHLRYQFDREVAQSVVDRLAELCAIRPGLVRLSPDLSHMIASNTWYAGIIPRRFGRYPVCDPSLPPNSIIVDP